MEILIPSSLLSVSDKSTFIRQNYGNNIRRKGNSDTYKYRCKACEALGRRPHTFASTAYGIKSRIYEQILVVYIYISYDRQDNVNSSFFDSIHCHHNYISNN
jgi:hypothetical protein